MNFKQLITHYLWSRSFSEIQLAKLLKVKEKDIFNWKSGTLPTPAEALNFQESTAYPAAKFWKIYFNSVALELGEDLIVETDAYRNQQSFVKASQVHRRLTNGNSIPGDEVFNFAFAGLSMDMDLNPQDLQTVIQVKLRINKQGEYNDSDILKLAKSYEWDFKKMKSLLKDKKLLPLDDVNDILIHSSPGYEKRRILLGYFSSIIKFLNLELYLSEQLSPAELNNLDKMSNTNLSRKKTRRKKGK